MGSAVLANLIENLHTALAYLPGGRARRMMRRAVDDIDKYLSTAVEKRLPHCRSCTCRVVWETAGGCTNGPIRERIGRPIHAGRAVVGL